MRLSIGVLVGLPLLALAFIILTALLIALRLWDADSYDQEIKKVCSVACIVAIPSLFVGAFFAYFPPLPSYHEWRPVSGRVDAISSRFLSSGQGTTQRFVVVLDGIGQRSCDDTRCALVHVGDTLSLTCKREWQWAGTPGWSCNYVTDVAAVSS